MVDNFNELMKLYYAEAVTQLRITDHAEIQKLAYEMAGTMSFARVL